MSGPHPAVARTRTAVRDGLAGVPPGALVLVACSGGADSLALAAATAFVAPRAGLRAGAVVVDHALRPDSAAVAATAARACRDLGLDPVRVARVDATASGSGPEAAAREARYAALTGAADALGAAAVLLGHTLDDQAETVLLALARGSGTRALRGMAPASGPWRRPLLGLRRDETRAACVALGLTPDEDPTNHPDGPWRTADGGPLRRAAVRHRALPALRDTLGPGVDLGLARTAELARADEDLLAALAEDLWARAVAPRPADGPAAGPADPAAVTLSIGALRDAHRALRARVLHRAALAAGADASALTSTHVADLEDLVARRGRGAAHLPGGVRAARDATCTCGASPRPGRVRHAPACGRLVLARIG